jgi:hypothetical protein
MWIPIFKLFFYADPDPSLSGKYARGGGRIKKNMDTCQHFDPDFSLESLDSDSGPQNVMSPSIFE